MVEYGLGDGCAGGRRGGRLGGGLRHVAGDAEADCQGRDRGGGDAGCLGAGADAEDGLERRGDRGEVEREGTRAPLARDRLVLEALGEGAPCAEDQCLDRRAREIELLGDLAVGAAAPLAEDDRAALKVGHVVECLFEPDELLARAVVPRGDLLQDLRVAQDLVVAAATARACAAAARVLRDREEPVRLQARDDSALESAQDEQECRLRRVLGLFAVAELVQAVAVHPVVVPLVERGRGGGGGRPVARTLGWSECSCNGSGLQQCWGCLGAHCVLTECR